MLVSVALIMFGILAGSCFFEAALVASYVVVDSTRLPFPLRACRYPFAKRSGPVDVAMPFPTRSRENLLLWRLLCGGLVAFALIAIWRDATDQSLASSLGQGPIILGGTATILFLLWSAFVAVGFRRARPH